MFDITSTEVIGFVRVTRKLSNATPFRIGNLKVTFNGAGGIWSEKGAPSISYNNTLQSDDDYGAKVIDTNTTGLYIDFTAILDDLTLFIGLKN